ncbi:methylated-DNA--protein-cysteine methyltransferase isoform X1 [Ursus americanus]|uniref:methylated-DNA--protein-cysteine methyltransferase isoform X1 n=1 Tax=Ursus americanus TaxID=9643 RepID=UPI001E67A912|nr:methylated-DNA--protein-cysteine methyltransferase isoform X1 [Ursus americanus]
MPGRRTLLKHLASLRFQLLSVSGLGNACLLWASCACLACQSLRSRDITQHHIQRRTYDSRVRLSRVPVGLIPSCGFRPNVGSPVPWPRLCCCAEVLGRMDQACEMSYKTIDSPLGKIEISGCEQGLHEIRLCGSKTPDAGPVEAPTLPELLGRPEEMTEPLVQCAAWLDAYFHEPEVLPGLPLPAIHHPVFQRDSFTAQVLWKLLEAVKFGDTVSYQQLAALAGNPKAARAVGGAMRSNPVPILVPCHRVVCSSGAMGNYSGGLATKEWLLAHEGRLSGKPTYAGVSHPAGTWHGAQADTPDPQRAGWN